MENRLSLYLETSKCFTFQSHHSKFVVNCLSCLKGKRRLHRRSFFENFPNSCLRRCLSPTNKLATSTSSIPSANSLWTCRSMKWLSLPSPVVERRKVLTRFKAEMKRSLTALVAGMTNVSLKRVQISLSRSLRALPSDWKKVQQISPKDLKGNDKILGWFGLSPS